MNIRINPKTLFVTLLTIIFLLLLANVMVIVAKYSFHLSDSQIIRGFWIMFSFEAEKNIPTFYSSITLFFSSLLLLIIAIKHKSIGSDYLGWLGLMFVFLFLSFDEFAVIHERLIGVTRQTFNTSGLLYFAWVIPYGVLVIVFVGVYMRFLLKLPKRIMILFIVSGTTFVLGAIGFEMLGGLHEEQYGNQNLIYEVLYTFEELLEMLGIALFIYTLFSYIDDQFDHLTITICSKKINFEG